jgi:predicted TIM-barrel fold metal-dependent hydrolase
MKPILMTSSDGHVGPPSESYRDYLDPKFRKDFDGFLEKHPYRWTCESPDAIMSSKSRDPWKGHPRVESGGIEALRDPKRRLQELDEDGIAAEILYPDDQNLNTPPWTCGIAPHAFEGERYPAELSIAGARAYNRWLAEFCSEAPERLIGMSVLGSLENMDAAIHELRYAYDLGLTKGVFMPLDYYLPLYHHPRYEPLWEACEELDLVLSIHASDGAPTWYGDNPRGGAVFLAEMGFFAQRPLWCFIFGGVFERHPKLRVAFTETGSAWVPGLLGQLDWVRNTESMRWTETDPLPKTPSEYFRDHCLVGNSLMTRMEVEQRGAVGIEQLMWGSDFPHTEGVWPETLASVKQIFADIPEDEARLILGDNLVRAYRLDRARLEPTVTRIGKSAAELGLGPASGFVERF